MLATRSRFDNKKIFIFFFNVYDLIILIKIDLFFLNELNMLVYEKSIINYQQNVNNLSSHRFRSLHFSFHKKAFIFSSILTNRQHIADTL